MTCAHFGLLNFCMLKNHNVPEIGPAPIEYETVDRMA
jgi:hypothetical protein